MKKIQSDITIIGGGLTALCIAYFLRSKKWKVSIVEARNRLGGRIETHYSANQASLERGATWLGKKHTHLVNLLNELDLKIFEQTLGTTAIYEPISTSPPQVVTLPSNNDPSFRIQGGSSSLINKLATHIDSSNIHLNQIVKQIDGQSEKLSVICDDIEFHSSVVISTLPPYLLASTISITPSLPEDLISIANMTHTWMGDSIKIGLRYKTPFWRSGNLSGTIISNVGPIPEMYDHSDIEDKYYALKGFFNGSYHSVSKSKRLELVLKQLEKYYGAEARNFEDYEEVVWRNEPFTFTEYNQSVFPHENNGHPIYQHSFLDNRFIIGGSETAPAFPGYMEGAVISAKYVCSKLEETLSSKVS